MITKNDVDYVAALARLEFSEEEKSKLTNQLDSILEYIDKLNELDTTGIKPTSHAISMTNVFREDEVMPSLDREKILQNAPDADKGCFKVPNILE